MLGADEKPALPRPFAVVYKLPGLRAGRRAKLRERGLERITEMDDDFELTSTQAFCPARGGVYAVPIFLAFV